MTRPGPLLGIDYGSKRIGLALADELGISLTALGFVERDTDARAATVVAATARQHAARALVVGLPLHAWGETSEGVKKARRFMRRVVNRIDLPVHEVDERYSSAEAEELLRLEGQWPAKPGQVDAKAAVIILKRYLAGDT